MTEEITTLCVAVVVSGFSLTGTIIGARAGIKEANKLTIYRIKQLEDKVMLHNNLVERMVTVEQEIPRLDTRIDDHAELVNQKLHDRAKFTDERIGALGQRITNACAKLGGEQG